MEVGQMARRQGSRSVGKISNDDLKRIMTGKYPWRAAPLDDGGGLRLKLNPGGGGSWQVRVMKDGRQIVQGLGSLDVVTAAQARVQAATFRLAVKQGDDPKAARQREAARIKIEAATFRAEADILMAKINATTRHPKTKEKWRNSFARADAAGLGTMRLIDITTPHIVQLVEPLLAAQYETANVTRRHVHEVFEQARVAGRFPDAQRNPAEASGLKHIYRHVDKLPVQHRPSMPFEDVPKFFGKLLPRHDLGSYALMLKILSGVRTREVIEARWGEFDESEDVWNIPASRMKSREDHAVPISSGIRYVLNKLRPFREHDGRDCPLFPARIKRKTGEPFVGPDIIRSMMHRTLDIAKDAAVPHGFRSSIRNWGGKKYSDNVMERVLAHVKGGVEGAYHRDDYLDERREVMEAWSDYCFSESEQKAATRLALVA
jgi:integrase